MAGAKYRQIEDSLRKQISSGILRPGDQLPTEPQLAESFDASRSTVRLAIGMLTTNGLVETRQGAGTFVRQPAAPLTVLLTREEDWQVGEHTDAALRPTGENTDRPVTARFLAETASASAEIAAALRVADGARVLVRRSHLYLDQEPWSLVASYYPMDIASGTPLEQAGQIDQSASLVLAEMGHRPPGYRDDICARMPEPAEADFFQLASAVPLTVVSRTAYDASRPVRLTMYVYRATAGAQVRLAGNLVPHVLDLRLPGGHPVGVPAGVPVGWPVWSAPGLPATLELPPYRPAGMGPVRRARNARASGIRARLSVPGYSRLRRGEGATRNSYPPGMPGAERTPELGRGPCPDVSYARFSAPWQRAR